MIFIKGVDSAVRVDQIAAFAMGDGGTVVVLLSGEKVLVRKSLDELLSQMMSVMNDALRDPE